MAEMDSTGSVTATNTVGPTGLLSRHTATGGSAFYAFDPQGSAAARLDGTGAALAYYTLDAFGSRVGTDASDDPYSGFGGQWGYYSDSETGLELLTHRYYDVATGRFVTRDPISYNGGVNLYGYTANNPINLIDPEGWAGYTPQYCARLLEKIQNARQELEETMEKYDPATDWKGGFPVGHGTGKLTQPYAHYFKIFDLQASIMTNIYLYNARCGNKGGGGTPLPPLQEMAPELSRVPVKGYPGYTGPTFYPFGTNSLSFVERPVRDDGFWLPLILPLGRALEGAGAVLKGAGAALGKALPGASRLVPVH